MPDLITVFVGVVSLVLGWSLKTLADAWTWRRQVVLDAYVELLAAVDRFGIQVGRVWSSGITDRSSEWGDRAERVMREDLMEIDRATGKMSLVARSRGAWAAFELYIACERMFRRAVALPPSAWEHYHEASEEMVKAYNKVLDEGRREMWLRHWFEYLPGRESRFEKMSQRMAELNRTDPYPDATSPAKQPQSKPR